MSGRRVLLEPIVALQTGQAELALAGVQGRPAAADLAGCEMVLEEAARLPRVGKLFLELGQETLRGAGVGGRLHDLVRRQGRHESEVTVILPEARAAAEPDGLERSVRDLREQGFPLALAGYGSGLGDLAVVQRWPVGFLKMNGGFVREIDLDSRKRTIVRATLEMGRELGASIVFEGVETPRQLDALRRLGAVYAQGPLFSPPASAAGLAEFWSSMPKTVPGCDRGGAPGGREPFGPLEAEAETVHELANLIAGITLLTDQMLERVGVADPLRQDLRLVSVSGERAASLTQRLQATRGPEDADRGGAPGPPVATDVAPADA